MGNKRTRGRKYDRMRSTQAGEHSRAQAILADERRRKARERYAERKAALRTNPAFCVPRQPRSERSIRRMVKRSVDFIRNLTGRDEELQSRIFSGLVSHHGMKGPRSLANVYTEKELRCVRLLLDNMADGLGTMKGTHSQDDVIAKKCIMRMFSSNEIVENRMCRASGRILKIASDDNNMQVGKWAGLKPGRKQRSDTTLPELKELVVKWWTERTRVSPVAKNVLKRDNHAIHTLDIPQSVKLSSGLHNPRSSTLDSVLVDSRLYGESMYLRREVNIVKREY